MYRKCILVLNGATSLSGIEKMTTKAEDIMQKIGEVVIALETPSEVCYILLLSYLLHKMLKT